MSSAAVRKRFQKLVRFLAASNTYTKAPWGGGAFSKEIARCVLVVACTRPKSVSNSPVLPSMRSIR